MSAGYDSRRYVQLNRWNPRNLQIVLDWIAPQRGDRVLDVGCGRGHLVRALSERGIAAYGIDLNPNAQQVAEGVLVATMSADALDFEDSIFDAVVSFHAIEHIPLVAAAVAEMARVVKPGGKVLLVYPAEPIRGLYAIPTSVILHGTPFKAREVHVHRLNPRKVRDLAENVGLREVRNVFRPWPSPEYASLLEAPGARRPAPD